MKVSTINFLVSIKNASVSNKSSIDIKANQEIIQILQCLYEQSFILSFSYVKKTNLIKIVFKTDTNLNILWDQSYGGSLSDYTFQLFFSEWNKLVVSGNSPSSISGNKTVPNYGENDIWFLVLNENDGSIVVQKTFGGSSYDLGYVKKSIRNETKLYIESNSQSGTSSNKTTINHGGYDFWMVELDASDFLATEELDAEGASISVYPNPYSEQVNFKLKQLKEAVTLSIATLDGKIVHTQTIQPSNENIEITWNPISTEQFLVYTIKGAKTNFTGKIVGF